LRRQDGIITLRQAVAAGLSPRGVRHRVAAGRWQRLYPRVYRAVDHELSDRARIRGAVLWAGRRAAVSGLAAAWWHGLPVACPRLIEITVARDRQLGARTGIRVRRRTLAANDLRHLDGVWVTGVPLTVLEAAVELGPGGSELMDRALQREVSFESIYRTHCRNLGRRGSPAAAALLGVAADQAASMAERRLAGLLVKGGIRGWRLGYAFGGFVLDVAFPEARVGIEVDGWAWHSDADRFRADRHRQNALVLAGWTVLRFTWDDLVHRPAQVLAEINSALSVARYAP
jgi:very-short-patch-repair endonuclease